MLLACMKLHEYMANTKKSAPKKKATVGTNVRLSDKGFDEIKKFCKAKGLPIGSFVEAGAKINLLIAQQGSTKVAMDYLKEALKADKTEGYSYYYGWKSNIAMSFFDAVRNHADNAASASAPYYEISKNNLHSICNNAAINFLEILLK